MSKYDELSKAKVKENRNMVISRNNSDGGYTMAQQVVVQEGKKNLCVFMAGAIHIGDLNALYEVRDALNDAIHKEEERQAKENYENNFK